MKKKNFIVGFSAAFAAILTLASCGGLRAKDGVVLTINGKAYTAEELFLDQKTPAAAEAKFNAVYKVAVRRYFEDGQDGHQYVTEITRDTKNKISGSKAEAQSNASKNGTSYDTEWNKILKNNNVEKESELYDKYEYDLMKSKFEDVFYSKKNKNGKTNYDVLRDGGAFMDESGATHSKDETIRGYLNEKQPYHIKHILVKIAGGKATDDVNCEITKDEAAKLARVIKKLAQGTSFEDVSAIENDDTTAKANFGSLGIMSRDTSFVNDFKLGIYLYETVYGSSTSDNGGPYLAKKAVKELFNVDDLASAQNGSAGWYANKIITELNDPSSINEDTTTPSKGTGLAIGKIPFGEVLNLETYSDYDYDKKIIKDNFDAAGLSKDDAKAKFFPRNVIFNKYFNKHNIMVITPDDAPSYGAAELGDTSKPSKYFNDVVEGQKPTLKETQPDKHYAAPNTTKYISDDYPGFKDFVGKEKNGDEVKFGTNTQNALRDNKGRIILVFRSGTGSSNSESNDGSSYQGIHFVVIERSPFIGQEIDNGHDGDPTKLSQYYTQYYPGQTDGEHPKYSDGKTDRYTFTNYIKNEKDITKLKARADTVKTELKKADDNLNTYIFDYLLDKGSITFADNDLGKELSESINKWISNTKRIATKEEKAKKWNDTWKDYYWDLKARQERRGEVNPTGIPKFSSLVPEICINAILGQNIYSSKKESGNNIPFMFNELFGKGGAFNE